MVDKKNKGWVKLWREQFQHWVSERKPWCDGYAWAYMYAQANHKRGIANFRNQYVTVDRGQFVTSILKMSKTFGWSWRRTRAFLESLEREGMIEKRFNTKSHNDLHNEQHNRFLIITVCNYDKYQSFEDEDSIIIGSTDRRTGAQQEQTNKNEKNEKKCLRGSPNPAVKEFIDFWFQSFRAKCGKPYMVNGGKEGALVKKLLGTHSLEDLKDLGETFFKSADPFIQKSDYTIGVFYSQINKLVAEGSQRKDRWDS